MLKELGADAKKGGRTLTATTYMPTNFGFKTTNQDAFKDFKVIPAADRAIHYSPDRRTQPAKAVTNHFTTTNMN
jgi:hypothetical protein